MGSLFEDDGQLGRFRTLSMLEQSPHAFRRRAAQCRELGQTCLTADAEQILSDLAGDLEREAAQLELKSALSVIGGGRR